MPRQRQPIVTYMPMRSRRAGHRTDGNIFADTRGIVTSVTVVSLALAAFVSINSEQYFAGFPSSREGPDGGGRHTVPQATGTVSSLTFSVDQRPLDPTVQRLPKHPIDPAQSAEAGTAVEALPHRPKQAIHIRMVGGSQPHVVDTVTDTGTGLAMDEAPSAKRGGLGLMRDRDAEAVYVRTAASPARDGLDDGSRSSVNEGERLGTAPPMLVVLGHDRITIAADERPGRLLVDDRAFELTTEPVPPVGPPGDGGAERVVPSMEADQALPPSEQLVQASDTAGLAGGSPSDADSADRPPRSAPEVATRVEASPRINTETPSSRVDRPLAPDSEDGRRLTLDNLQASLSQLKQPANAGPTGPAAAAGPLARYHQTAGGRTMRTVGAVYPSGLQIAEGLNVRIEDGEIVSVQLSELISLFERKLDRPLFVWLKDSGDAKKFVTPASLAKAGIGLAFDKASGRAILSVSDADGQ